MRAMMQNAGRESHGQKGPKMATVDPLYDQLNAGLAAKALSDAHAGASPKKIAAENGASPRTARRWANDGHGNPVHRFGQLLLHSQFPWRLVAYARAIALKGTIDRESRAELIEKTRELLRQEKRVEGNDNVQDVSRGVCWLDRAAAKERDASIDAELAARFRRCAELRIQEAEIFG